MQIVEEGGICHGDDGLWWLELGGSRKSAIEREFVKVAFEAAGYG